MVNDQRRILAFGKEKMKTIKTDAAQIAFQCLDSMQNVVITVQFASSSRCVQRVHSPEAVDGRGARAIELQVAAI